MQEPVFKRITLEDKPLIDAFFLSAQPQLSEYTFTNMYAWGSFRELEYASYEGGILFRAHHRGERYFLSPVGYSDCERIYRFMADYGASHGLESIKLVTGHQKHYAHLTGYPVVSDRPDWDYVYRTESLATLKGWRLDGKRGFVKKFRENYRSEWVSYDNSYKDACIGLLDKWMEGKREGNPGIEEEYQALRLFLDQFDRLGCVGGLLFADGKLAAFTFGERLNDRTFVVHFEKADTSFTGVFQTVCNQFVLHEAAGKYDFVNREQDLGIEGIRKAKTSWAPFRHVKKYTLELQKK
jgi:hypothetical protein